MAIIGVDTGGTFTDLVIVAGGEVHSYKLPSTPHDFSSAVLEGTEELARTAGVERFDLAHSSTVSTNAVLERKGARAALITTAGFRDALEIGRQTRPELYNLNVERTAPLIPRTLRFEVDERTDHTGRIIRHLDEVEAKALLKKIKKKGIRSVAVSLLFSFLNPRAEQTIGRMARGMGLAASLGSELLPEFREYERTSATAVNAFVSPVMTKYLDRLSEKAKGQGARRLRIVQSNGGSLSARAAGSDAIHTLLSGPAAGIIGALSVARQALGAKGLKLITFDMGGTSTDVSLIDGSYKVTTEYKLDGLPVPVPMMDIHTVGAGGGSLAAVDPGGALQVGPQSAGADPGPACYGKGTRPTVTDANVALGRIDPSAFLGGRKELDEELSRRALQTVAKELDATPEETARGVLDIVNSNMERAIRVISVERGYDPREFTLMSFGGAGGLHACDLAAALNIPRVLIPVNPGVLSAWGAVAGDVVKDYSRTVMRPVHGGAKTVEAAYRELERQARADMKAEGFTARKVALTRQVDLRYEGQSYELTVPCADGLAKAAAAFHRAHEKRYGHAEPDAPLTAVTVRLNAVGALPKPSLRPIPKGKADARKALTGRYKGMKVYDRTLLKAGNRISGPALVTEAFATAYLPKGWRITVDRYGNLLAEGI